MDKQTAVTVKPKKVSPRTGTSAKPTKDPSAVATRTVAKQSATHRERAKAARQARANKAPRKSANALTASGLYYATELERVTIIRQGLPANILVQIGRAMDMSNDLLFSTLALPRSTVVRKIQKNEALSAEQSERVVGLERLVGQVEAMVKQSGNADVSMPGAGWVTGCNVLCLRWAVKSPPNLWIRWKAKIWLHGSWRNYSLGRMPDAGLAYRHASPGLRR